MGIKINLHEFIGDGSKIYSGRDEGLYVRIKLSLSEKDKDNNSYTFVIPPETYSITRSFFGGMLGDSVKLLGENDFRKKYSFEDCDGHLKDVIKRDYEEGIYEALSGL